MKGVSSRSAAGYLSVAVAAVLWASSGVVGKALFEQGVSPMGLVQMRATLAAGLLVPALLLRAPGLLRVPLADLGRLALLGGVALALVQVSYFYAISLIPVAAAILLQYLAPVFVALFAMGFWGERATAAKLGALALATAGAFLVVGGHEVELEEMNQVGVVAGLVSALCFAGYTLLGERLMERRSPWTVLAHSMLFAAVSLHLVYPPFHYLRAGYTPDQWAAIAYVGVFGTLVPFGLYFAGVNLIRSTRASITATLEPISAAGFAFLFLGESLGPVQLLGGGLVIAAVVVLNLGARDTTNLTPAAIRGQVGEAAGRHRS
ncbi:MAG: DMT family transporter [Deferrisomatales bacterium]